MRAAGPRLLRVDPASRAGVTADAWRSTRPAGAALMDRIAAAPQVEWVGDWLSDVGAHTRQRTSTIVAP